MRVYYASDYNWVEINEGEVVDLAVGNHYAGCRCSLTNRGEVGDCKNFNNCLKDVVYKMNSSDRDYLIKLLNLNK